ncbi:unnamed protein product [Brachionus calyciflorus]|uniref:G-protein coupled receptors family 1 profile domain-containing protein n=1 Tax=Brachionus calyciflorus TaxID=104777 RepID=A0A814KUU4_9BILA|nr:unnamed protein product [Brachionus calyciflorus]
MFEDLSKRTHFFFSSTFVPTGIVFNFLTILIFQSKSFNGSNIRIFYTALALYDNLALMNSIVFIQLLPSLDIDYALENDSSCKWLMLWRRTVIQSPSWIQVILTYDLFKQVVFPGKYKIEKTAYLICKFISVFFILLSFNITHFWYFLKENKTIVYQKINNQTINSTRVTFTCTSTESVLTVANSMLITLRCYVPFLVMFILNIFMVRKFILTKKNLKKGDSKMRREYYFTFSVLTMNLIFIILFIPWTVWHIMSLALYDELSKSKELRNQMNLFQSISLSIAYVNCFKSFFVNVIINKKFFKVFMHGYLKKSITSVRTFTSSYL